MTTLFCWERDCLSVLKLKVMIKLNSLRSFLNIHVDYVLRSSFTSLTKMKMILKRRTTFPFFNKKQSSFTPPIVVMNKWDYIAEVERQLHNSTYYEKLQSDPSEEVKSRRTV